MVNGCRHCSRPLPLWHDSSISMPWLIHTCGMTHGYVWHDLIHDIGGATDSATDCATLTRPGVAQHGLHQLTLAVYEALGVCVCARARTCVCLSVCAWVCVLECVFLSVCAWVCVLECVCLSVCAWVCMLECVCLSVCAWVCVLECVCLSVCVLKTVKMCM